MKMTLPHGVRDTIAAQALARSPSAVAWLECGDRPADVLFAEIERLAQSLGGRLSILEGGFDYMMAAAEMPRAAAEQFKGALALAGASFALGDPIRTDGPILVFILSNAQARVRDQQNTKCAQTNKGDI